MAIKAIYNPPRGQGTFSLSRKDGLKEFVALKEVDVTEEEAELLKAHKHFTIDGRPAAFYGMLAAKSAPNGGKAPEDDGRPKLPANGFQKKEDAIVFARVHFNLELKDTVALKTMNDKINQAWQKKFGGVEATAPADAGDTFMDTAKSADPGKAVEI